MADGHVVRNTISESAVHAKARMFASDSLNDHMVQFASPQVYG